MLHSSLSALDTCFMCRASNGLLVVLWLVLKTAITHDSCLTYTEFSC